VDRSASLRERAFLVGLEVRTRSRNPAGPKAKNGPPTAEAQAARDTSAGLAAAKAPNIPEFTAEESLAELRSLAVSAGAEVVGEFLQHRDRPDPATLVGRGKLEEIAGATASVSADLLLFDPQQLHGNLPFEGERLSAIFYCERRIAECGDCGVARNIC